MRILIDNTMAVACGAPDWRILRRAKVLIEDGLIADVLPADAPSPQDCDEVIDADGLLLTPGLINTHHHLYQTLTRNLPEAQNAALFDWLTFHYEVWRGLDEELLSVATRTALSELLLSGCTLSSDHHYIFPRAAAPDLIDRQIEVAAELGIRFQPTRGSMSLGRSAGGLPPDDLCQGEDEIAADSRRLIKRWHDPSPGAMIRIDLAPCSPFSVTGEAMRAAAALAREAGVRLHTHLAETLDEEKFCLATRGQRPLAHMNALGWLGSDVWFAHTVHLSADEIVQMGSTGTGMSHCPSSNMRLGSGIAPISELLAATAPVSLAVDGSASNDCNHLLAEARQMLLLSRLREEGKWLTAREVWTAATLGGARVLGRDKLGRIEAGALADLVLWDLRGLDMAGAQSDPLAALLFAAAAPRAHTVLVGGAVRVRDGRIPGLDEQAQAAQHNAAAEKLLSKRSND